MKFHGPSFLHYLKLRLDMSFDVYTHNWICYVITSNKYFTKELMKNVIREAIIASLDAPLVTPDGPRLRSVIDAPIDSHCSAVEAALSVRCEYLEKHRILTPVGERIEFRILLKVLRQIVIDVRREQDVKLAKELIKGEVFVSDRLLSKRFLRFVGVAFSNRRTREIMHALEDEGILKSNGNLRTNGREVVQWN